MTNTHREYQPQGQPLTAEIQVEVGNSSICKMVIEMPKIIVFYNERFNVYEVILEDEKEMERLYYV